MQHSSAPRKAVLNAIAITLLAFGWASGQEYKLGPDSVRQPGVPQGKVTKHSYISKIYPGTTHDYWVYVPVQYQTGKPAAVMVFVDGGSFVAEDGAWRVPIVFDNLIHRGEMPNAIGVFVDPGVLPVRISKENSHAN